MFAAQHGHELVVKLFITKKVDLEVINMVSASQVCARQKK